MRAAFPGPRVAVFRGLQTVVSLCRRVLRGRRFVVRTLRAAAPTYRVPAPRVANFTTRTPA
jgi:hypothetical protein